MAICHSLSPSGRLSHFAVHCWHLLLGTQSLISHILWFSDPSYSLKVVLFFFSLTYSSNQEVCLSFLFSFYGAEVKQSGSFCGPQVSVGGNFKRQLGLLKFMSFIHLHLSGLCTRPLKCSSTMKPVVSSKNLSLKKYVWHFKEFLHLVLSPFLLIEMRRPRLELNYF